MRQETDTKNSPDPQGKLRQRAEKQLQDDHAATASPDDMVATIHELQVYQTELEIQNEDMRNTQRALEEVRNRYIDLYDFAPVGYVTLDAQGIILEANLTMATMLSEDRGKLVKRPLRHYLVPEAYDTFYFFQRGLFHKQEPQQTILQLHRADTTPLIVRLQGVPLRGSEAKAGRARVTVSDITEQEESKLVAEQRILELLSLQDALEETQEAREKAEAETGRRQRVEAELRFLLSLTTAVNAAHDFDDALRIVMKALCLQEERIYGEAWLPNQAGDALQLSSVFHLEKPEEQQKIMQFRTEAARHHFTVGVGLMGKAWATEKLIWVEDVQTLDTDTYPRQKDAQLANLHAALIIPIMAEQNLVAILGLYKDIPNQRNERFLALAVAAATQLAVVLQSKQTQAALQKAHHELEGRVTERTAELAESNSQLVEQIAERKQAQERLKQRNDELELLNSFSQMVSKTLEMGGLVQCLETILSQTLQLPGGFIFFYDTMQEGLNPRHGWGMPTEMLTRFLPSLPQHNPCLQIITEAAPVLESDISQISFFQEHRLTAVRPTWRSFLGVPVILEEKVQGVLGLFRESPFSPGQVSFFRALGQVMGTAVQNARLFATVSEGREQLRRLTHSVFQTQETERRRISRELHDEAGQALTGLKIHLEMSVGLLQQMKGGNLQTGIGDLENELTTAVQLSQSTMDQIRTLAHALRPAALENLGLNTALQSFCRDFSHRTRLYINYLGQETPSLPDAIEIGLYRFLQEALTNVARHAQAGNVEVNLRYDVNTISLSVSDDGQGFIPTDLHTSVEKIGIGLPGMQERIEGVDGRLSIRSAPGEGTHLVAWIPL